MSRSRSITISVALAVFLAVAGHAAEVRFETNDAHVKDKAVEGVRILIASEPGGDAVLTAVTDEGGVALVDLDPGTWWISYVRSGYVPIGDSQTEIRGDGQVVTTTLSMLLEAEGGAGRRRVRIVLNWGSRETQVRDADAHAYCVCGRADDHVYFADMRHEYLGHVVELDVDDREWGGPETITLTDPEPGAYRYWVHQYSRDEEPLGASDVVVRVFFDDALEGEFRIPFDLTQRTWKPFREIVVDADLVPRLVRFTPEELAARQELVPPPDELSEEGSSGFGDPRSIGCTVVFVAGFIAVWLIIVLAIKRARR